MAQEVASTCHFNGCRNKTIDPTGLCHHHRSARQSANLSKPADVTLSLKYHDPYSIPGTDVLKNKFNTGDKTDLAMLEMIYTAERLKEIDNGHKRFIGSFDKRRLKAIHKHIFQDVYEWAGEYRTVEIGKGTQFALVNHLDSYGDEIFKSIANDSDLWNSYDDKKMFAERLAEHYFDLNSLHPFREGNGRTQREFFRQLSRNVGWKLDFKDVSEEENIFASVESINGNLEPGIEMFMKCISQ